MIGAPIRIAVVLGHWQNYGVETLTMNLYKNIDKSRVQFDFYVCETPNSDVPKDEIESLGGRLLITPSYSKPLAYGKVLKSAFKENNYQIVHCHMSTLCVFPLSAAKAAGVPIRIAHCHTMAGKGEWAKNAVKYTLRLLAHRYPTHYASSSLMAGEWLFGHDIATNNMYYVPVARDIEAFRYSPDRRTKMREALGLNGKYVIGHLGRFVPQKNHKFIVDMFSHVYSLEPKAHLLLAGDGPLVEETLTAIDAYGLSEHVSYLGRRSDASDLYQAMDVFVLPSIYEGVPGTGIEAQAAGLPFLCSSLVTKEALILDSAKRIPLDDMDAWVAAVLDAERVPRRDSVGEMKRAGYDIKTAANDLADYYESLIKAL